MSSSREGKDLSKNGNDLSKNLSPKWDDFLAHLTTLPGVYIMYGQDSVLYVGKAKNLKKRVSSYFHRQLDTKTIQLIKQVQNIEVTVTRNEREALLLESNLIKSLDPRYNVIFKDDKSYPYLFLSIGQTFPRLTFHRGEEKEKGKYFGPYPNAKMARDALSLLQRIFKIRQCEDTFFKNRTRPCLQYQIKRCTAPCVGYIDEAHYQKDVQNTRLFLEGKEEAVVNRLITEMNAYSEAKEYEQAARVRDNISLLRQIQQQQIIMGSTHRENVDVLAVAIKNDNACIHRLVIRQGRMLGSRQYFPNKNALFQSENQLDNELDNENGLDNELDNHHTPEEELLEAFILQHYGNQREDGELGEIPREILVSVDLHSKEAIIDIIKEHALKAEKTAGTQSLKEISLSIYCPKKGDKLKWVQMSKKSALVALESRFNTINTEKARYRQQFEELQDALSLEAIPERIECFDVSHSLGESTVASCVVYDITGPNRSLFRRYNIKKPTGGDDYAAMEEALFRRYTRLKEEGKRLPDILLIDGGKGQLTRAEKVLEELQVAGVTLIGVAKGASRKAGQETLYLSSGGETLSLDPSRLAFHLIQEIRNNAHRFALNAHQKQRRKRRVHSVLEDIPGVGPKRRRALLQRFGGLIEIKQATTEELAKTEGISYSLAERIYKVLHGS